MVVQAARRRCEEAKVAVNFELFFGGGEAPSLRKLLLANEVKHVAISFFHLRPRLPKTKLWKVETPS